MAAGRILKSSKAGMFFRILIKSIRVRRKRVAIAFFSLTIGAAIITALASVYFDISMKMSRELRTYGANFFIGPETSTEDRIIDYRVFENVIRQVPEDKLMGASPYLYGIARLDLGKVVMAGVDFSELKKLSPYWQVQGSWISVDFDEKHCMVGRSLAKSMELQVGDKVNIMNRGTGFHRAIIVKGIVETGQAEDEQIFVNLSLAQKILGLEGKINHVMLSLVTQGFDIPGLAARLEGQLQEIDAKSIRKVSYSEGKILKKIEGLMALVAAVILTITTLCLMTTLMAMVVERTGEIGLMKAIGAESKTIVLQFLSETAVISLAGGLAGLVVGFILAQILGLAVFNSSISFRLIVLPLTLIISLVVSLLAAAIPVRMAGKVVPAQALRGE